VESFFRSGIIVETTGPIMYVGSNIDFDIITQERSKELMPFTLQTIVRKIELVPNAVNRRIINDFLSI
ncbi:MAG: hypothetical protein WB511_15330, partial [Nitrososphaeraceae archaeon]